MKIFDRYSFASFFEDFNSIFANEKNADELKEIYMKKAREQDISDFNYKGASFKFDEGYEENEDTGGHILYLRYRGMNSM